MAFFQNMYYTCSCPDERAKKCDRECHRFRLMTHTESNADRIRAMTDEDLAKKISGIEQFALTTNGAWPADKWLDWLKQEASDG